MNEERHWAEIVILALRPYPGPRRAAMLEAMEGYFERQANLGVMRAIRAYRSMYAERPIAANDD